jgi:hypothetical protein
MAKNEKKSPALEHWYQRNPGIVWLISTLVTVVFAVYGIVLPHLEKDQDEKIQNQMNAALKEPMAQIQATRAEIAELKGEWETLKPLLQSRVQENLKNSVRLKPSEFEKSLPSLRATIVAAKNANIPAPPNLVAQVGQRVIETATKSTESGLAWQTAKDFMAYRSSNNSTSVSLSEFHMPETHYTWNKEHGRPDLQQVFGVAPISQAAAISDLSSWAKPINTVGNQFILFSGGKMKIDGLRLRNVIFKDMTIAYDGGPLLMENVTFINCKFDFPSSKQGQALALAVLQETNVKFSAS